MKMEEKLEKLRKWRKICENEENWGKIVENEKNGEIGENFKKLENCRKFR